jgi:hypothetical protein
MSKKKELLALLQEQLSAFQYSFVIFNGLSILDHINGVSYFSEFNYNDWGYFMIIIVERRQPLLAPRNLGSPFIFYGFNNFSPTFHIDDIKAVEILVDNVPVSTFKRAAIGTLIFGAVGTVAGIISSITTKAKSIINVVIYLDSIELSAITLYCKKMSDVSRLLSTFANLETSIYANETPEISSTNQAETIDNQIINSSITDDIVKLKKLLDEGGIDIDEYNSLKKKLISGD